MLKVRCNMCENEVNGFCSKKKQSGKPVKIRLNKPRVCGIYEEAATRVLADYRKRESHKKKLGAMAQQRIFLAEAIQKAQSDLSNRKQESDK